MKPFLYLLLLIGLISCDDKKGNNLKDSNGANSSVYITGKAPGVLNGMRVYYNKLGPRNSSVAIDTAMVVNESFTFDFEDSNSFSDIRFLTVDGVQGNLVFLSQKNPMSITIDKDTISNSTIEGSNINNELRDYEKLKNEYAATVTNLRTSRGNAMRANDVEEQNKLTEEWAQKESQFTTENKNIITSNSDNLLGPMVIGELLSNKLIETTEARRLYNNFSDEVKQHEFTQRIDSFLSQSEVVAIGAKAPEFEGLNPDKEVIKLKDVVAAGKVTLVDFWASWCRPCRLENPNVVAAYEKYHDKGFNIISVSLDRKNGEAAWKQAIKDDQMDWYHVSRLNYFGPIAKQYNVSSIPSTFLLDGNGVIIAKNLRGQALHDKLAELL